MKFNPTSLEGVLLVEAEPNRDERGSLTRTYCEHEFAARSLNTRWVQQNHTLTKEQGTVRGMHYQAMPAPEIKLVRCLAGRVLDVVVDIRRDSPTFGQWTAYELSPQKMNALYVPAGFAHGFQSLSNDCELLYLMSEFYVADLARGIRWDDPAVGIQWPFPPIGLSARDRTLPLLAEVMD